MALERHPPLQNRGHRPPHASQFDKQGLGKRPATGRTEAGLGFAADHLAGPGVTVTRLAVQRLHARQQTSRKPKPGQHTAQLHRMASPVAEQRPQDLEKNPHLSARPRPPGARGAIPPFAPVAPPRSGYG
ncbi:hypothetical protein D3C73_748510 [compost metagenome]